MRSNYNKKDPKIYSTRWGTWRVRFFDECTDQYREKTCSTKTEAENLRRAIVTDANLSQWFPDDFQIDKQVKTFEDLAEKWLEHGQYVRRISKSCLNNYQTQLKFHILPIIGNVVHRKLSIEHIERLAKSLKGKNPMSKSYQAIRKNRWDEIEEDENSLSVSYQREILTVVLMITSWASGRTPPLMHVNPFKSFVLPKAPEHLYDYWTLADEDQFFDWIEAGAYYETETTRYSKEGGKSVIKMQLRNYQELRDIVLMALRTGMRLGEIGGLRNADVDLSRGCLVVRGTYDRKERVRKGTTKSKKARRIEFNEDVREILEKRKFKPQKEALFNINMNSIKFFSRTCRLAGVKEIHFHSLRHTCLTNLANGYGMVRPLPLPKVQQIAGHSDIKTTMRYVHNDLIDDTASLQYSRKQRKAGATVESSDQPNSEPEAGSTTETPAETSASNVVSIKKGLRLVASARK